MVQVQSTWFPVIDRNPQRFVPNIFLAAPSDFQPATQRIYCSGARVTTWDALSTPGVEAGDSADRAQELFMTYHAHSVA